MKLYNLQDDTSSTMPKGRADFLLATCVTLTCNIEGITQAGISGKIYLTPTLDAEFLTTGKVFSLEDIAETASGIPTPGLLSRAVHTLSEFSHIGILDLGLEVIPQECKVYDFDIKPSVNIAKSGSFDAKSIFEKGRDFGKKYKLRGDYLILGESTPSGTTTAQASVEALGFKSKNLFASSFKNAPIEIKQKTISLALAKIDDSMSSFEKLSHVSDNMLMFVAGFILEASRRFKIVLGGATQMAAALLIADTLAQKYQIHYDYRNISLATTSWIAKDGSSNITELLNQLSFRIKALYSDFSYCDANIPVLRLYDEGEAKEGVGAGAALCYASGKGISQKEITSMVEKFMTGGE